MANGNEELFEYSRLLDNVDEQCLDDDTITGIWTSNLQQNIASLYLNHKFSDVSFILHGQKLYAHKVILAVRSKYFESLLFGSLMEASQSEIPLTDVSPNVFKKLLKFIYTDHITVVAANLDLTLGVLDLANKFCINELEITIGRKLSEIIDANNVCKIMQRAELYNLSELLDSCLSFIDEHAPDFLKSEEFNNQSQEILVQILKRDSFIVPEIEIFSAIAQYYKINEKSTSDLLHCVRLSSMTLEEIYSVVKPTKLVDDGLLLKAVGEITEILPRNCPVRCFSSLNVNVATLKEKAQLVFNQNKDLNFLLNGNKLDDKFASFPMGITECFTVKLETPTYINNIQIFFHIGADKRSYSYYIESSISGKLWKRIIDYTNYKCRASQELYFEKKMMKYVRVVGTFGSANTLDIVSFEAYFKDTIPKQINGIICPTSNVALLSKGATLIEGGRDAILNGDFTSSGYTYHKGSDSIVIQLAQPYMIDTIRLRLFDQGQYSYKYYIEGSLNKIVWTMIADRRNEYCISWQDLNFEARPVLFIKITGTSCSQEVENNFHCYYMECFASKELREDN